MLNNVGKIVNETQSRPLNSRLFKTHVKVQICSMNIFSLQKRTKHFVSCSTQETKQFLREWYVFWSDMLTSNLANLANVFLPVEQSW